MARAFQRKASSETRESIAFTQQPNNTLQRACLFKVNEFNRINLDETAGYFILNPSSYDEHKSSNWVSHNIPGQSDPILQWVSGGTRTIAFEALVTKDHAGFDLTKPVSGIAGAIDGAIQVVGNIASSFLGVSLPPIADLFPVGSSTAGTELSIADYLNFYRSLMYPTVEKDKLTLKNSPPLVALFVGETFSKNMQSNVVSLDTDLWVVSDLRIKITKQLPNLDPMEAIVTFQLSEYIRTSKSVSNFDSDASQDVGEESSLGSQLLDAVKDLF